MSEEKRQKLQETGLVEWSVFSEIVAMDEDEEGFSQSLVQTFVDQVEETFEQINTYISEKNLEKLSSAGHFLKGSAAALGLTTISNQCERIQNYGHKVNFDNFTLTKSTIDPSSSSSLSNIGDTTRSNNHSNINSSGSTPSPENNYTPVESGTQASHSLTDIPDESSDDFWIALIKDALNKARDGFEKSRAALNEYYA
ncbi:YPD1 [[Candida] subhashii]|uniref:YPD1 n=1 Tax=[Candida] subhashii TaxID=561895 RepID=A0A8J5V5R6_9ASCO|nr:YPD1 [[Candida] subhashii]KAG7666214.1 YPD1 [[Candida] subhashii]